MIKRDLLISRAREIIDSARTNGITLRVIGGAAVAILAPQGSSKYYREYKDIDFFAYSKQRAQVEKFLESQGLIPNKRFNALHGYKRLMFYDEKLDSTVDVFLDKFEMCHSIDFRNRLEIMPYTIPPSDLLLTKLQICKMTEGDVKDVFALLTDLDLGEKDDERTIDLGRITSLLSDDWGFFTTVTDNINALLQMRPEEGIAEKLSRLLKELDSAPKSLKWKMRAKVGRRVKWYQEPEEVGTFKPSAGGGI